MRLQQDSNCDNDRARSEQDCQVNSTHCSIAAKHRRGAKRVCCKFRDFLSRRDGKRKDAAAGEAAEG